MTEAQVVGPEDRWAMSPGYTVVPLASTNAYTTMVRTRYPDGSWWHIISIAELRDDEVVRLEFF